MEQLRYQLKNIRRDKMCILTFLLPIIFGLGIQLLSQAHLQTVSETSFGVLKNSVTGETAAWLSEFGNVTEYETKAELTDAVRDPSTQMIGVLREKEGISTLLAGDELAVNKTIGDTLPRLYEYRTAPALYKQTIVPAPEGNEGLKTLLTVITIVTAMFMGCTFNAMSIIGEKEDGIATINQILPMTVKVYIRQKLLLGFAGGSISTLLTALIVIRLRWSQILPLILIAILSAYIAALLGVLIGHFSAGLMTGIVYIKVLMVLFIAPPILFYLTVSNNSVMHGLSYLLVSSASFYGLMDLLSGQTKGVWMNVIILGGHAILWSAITRKALR